ncbi:hypothetical protein [Candidatus Roseilinea sp. NK_OTU-006]|jgi:ABC-type lipopolysaccharide export system ATPase subunit|uniref:hypothetical protein n=1 Tax=Candidatus Roseilinea sp. NK_OTU-006 TaxID=2704250 RepID=UPI00197D9A4E|nr:hypothetical protein [Candidatus Roseilinea sp. NK_OTU-006]
MMLAAAGAFTIAAIGPKASPLLSAPHLGKRYGVRPMLRDVSLKVAPGEFVAILGAGKTTRSPGTIVPLSQDHT